MMKRAKATTTCLSMAPECQHVVESILSNSPDLLLSSISSTSTQLSEAAATATSFISSSSPSSSSSVSVLSSFLYELNVSIDKEASEAIAGPFFGLSLFPYLAFLYFLDRPENDTPKGVTVGFCTCLLFVVLTIPAAIAAKLLFGVSLADCDWLHGSAESLLTVTNLVTVIAFRQALQAKEQQIKSIRKQQQQQQQSVSVSSSAEIGVIQMPASATSYAPMTGLVVALTALATVTVLVPGLSADTTVHTPWLGGILDVPESVVKTVLPFAHDQPDNALTILTWIIHVSSLVEFLVAMGFCWRWADIVGNSKWKGLTWGLLPLHTSGLTACVSHLFYNHIPILVPLQAFLTCVGNTTAAWAAYRIAVSNGWTPASSSDIMATAVRMVESASSSSSTTTSSSQSNDLGTVEETAKSSSSLSTSSSVSLQQQQLVGFEDLGDALAGDNDYSFLLKLFIGCAAVSYGIKYGETLFDFPFSADLNLALVFILGPTSLNVLKWYKRSGGGGSDISSAKDGTFKGWF